MLIGCKKKIISLFYVKGGIVVEGLMMSFYAKKEAVILVGFILFGLGTLQAYFCNKHEVYKHLSSKRFVIKVFYFITIFSFGIVFSSFNLSSDVTDEVIFSGFFLFFTRF
jgi:hypothetical protein